MEVSDAAAPPCWLTVPETSNHRTSSSPVGQKLERRESSWFLSL